MGLAYETKYLDFAKGEQKVPEYLKLNPHGRMPTIVDHSNNDFTVWYVFYPESLSRLVLEADINGRDSTAILTYLVDKYDPEHKISARTEREKYSQIQWLYFQSSDQASFFGHTFYLTSLHSEKIPSVANRYKSEVIRIIRELDGVLAKQKWLVGGKPSVADFAFVM